MDFASLAKTIQCSWRMEIKAPVMLFLVLPLLLIQREKKVSASRATHLGEHARGSSALGVSERRSPVLGTKSQPPNHLRRAQDCSLNMKQILPHYSYGTNDSLRCFVLQAEELSNALQFKGFFCLFVLDFPIQLPNAFWLRLQNK